MNLTPREQEIANQVGKAKRNMDIAIALGISETVVKFHLTNIFKKFGVKSRTELAIKLAKDENQLEFPA